MFKFVKYTLRKVVPYQLLEYLSPLKRLSKYYFPYLFLNGIAKPPETVVIEVTYACNCSCRMCPLYVNESKVKGHIERKDEELSAKQWKDVIDQLRQFGVRSVIFSGGEPFLKNDILDVMEYAKSIGLYVAVITNGSNISEEDAKRLVAIKVNNISISLDGPREVHNNIRQKDIFDSVMKSVDHINQAKKEKRSRYPVLKFSCVVSSLNQTSLADIIKIGHEKGMSVYYHRVMFTTPEMENAFDNEIKGSRTKPEDLNIPEEIVRVDVKKMTEEIKRIKETEKKYHIFYSIFLNSKKDVINSFHRDNFSLVNKCLYPWSQARIDPYGVVYPCSINVSMGDVKKEQFGQIWNGQNYVNFRKQLKQKGLFAICNKCCVMDKNNYAWNLLPKF